MDSQIRGVLLGLAVAFLILFTGMTFVALSTAQLNFASIMAFGFSFLIIGLITFAIIGAIRNPPDED